MELIGTRIAILPTKEQEKQLFRYAGAARFIYNWSLAFKINTYKEQGINLRPADMSRIMTQLKKTEELSWLNEINNETIKQAIKDMCSAFDRMFKYGSGFPKFKKRNRTKPSFYCRYDRIRSIDSRHVQLPGFKEHLKTAEKVTFADIKNPRVSYDCKHWYLSYATDITNYNFQYNSTIQRVYKNYQEIKSKQTTEALGIDLGISYMAVDSNNNYYENINKTPEVQRLQKKLKRIQQQISRKYEMNKKGGVYIKTKNIIKLERQAKLIHRRISNIRNSYIHTITTEVVKTKPSKVVIENLKVSNMMKNKHLSKSIQEQEFYKFRLYLAHKCSLYGIPIEIADTFYPSSKRCSRCGTIKQDLKLKDREYICNKCGLEINRDYNAAINLKNYNSA